MFRRLRPSLFPNCPPYLHFINNDQEYEEAENHVKDLKVVVAKGTSESILDCFHRLGVTIIEVKSLHIEW